MPVAVLLACQDGGLVQGIARTVQEVTGLRLEILPGLDHVRRRLETGPAGLLLIHLAEKDPPQDLRLFLHVHAARDHFPPVVVLSD